MRSLFSRASPPAEAAVVVLDDGEGLDSFALERRDDVVVVDSGDVDLLEEVPCVLQV